MIKIHTPDLGYDSDTFTSFHIFLAGPTPRDESQISWRKEFIDVFTRKYFEKNVSIDVTFVVPERRDWAVMKDYDDQIDWEQYFLDISYVIAFWIPRTKEMPGLTTNVEFGMYYYWPNTMYGRPNDAMSIRYLDKIWTDSDHVTKYGKYKEIQTNINDYCDELINLCIDFIYERNYDD